MNHTAVTQLDLQTRSSDSYPNRRIAVIPAALGLVFTLWAMWSAGIDASGLSLLLMLMALPVY